MNKRISELSKFWYQKYGMGYNTPPMSDAELQEHLYRKGFEKGYEIGQSEQQKIKDDEILCEIKWTVADVRKAFEETYKRQPDDNELQEAIDSISWEDIEDSSIENGWTYINTAIADIFNEEV